MKLTSENVHACFIGSLFEDPVDPVHAEATAIKSFGITMNIGFDPNNLNKFREDIKSMVLQLPGIAEGNSFLNMCMDAEGHHWGEHRNIEELILLGQAIDLIECAAPRDMWDIFPGGMPYYMLKTDAPV